MDSFGFFSMYYSISQAKQDAKSTPVFLPKGGVSRFDMLHQNVELKPIV